MGERRRCEIELAPLGRPEYDGWMAFPDDLPPGWKKQLASEAQKLYFKELSSFLVQEYQQQQRVFPLRENILRAIHEVDFDQVRVVVLGQDPYHGDGQAIGRSFAVPNEHFPKPPSLQNIFKEIRADLGIEISKEKSDLSGWGAQGVLLLNTVLTVRAHQAFSHRNRGWELFTDQIIRVLNEREEPVIFILWGAAAQKKKALITQPQHFFLESPHPSPLSASRGFFGCRHFSKANEILDQQLSRPTINWEQTVQE